MQIDGHSTKYLPNLQDKKKQNKTEDQEMVTDLLSQRLVG
jgi:hypothetical protein